MGIILIAAVVTGIIGYLHYELTHAYSLDPSYTFPEDEDYRPRR